MVASRETVADILRVVLKHVSHATMKKIITELRTVEGNASFKQTIVELEKHFEKKSGWKTPDGRSPTECQYIESHSGRFTIEKMWRSSEFRIFHNDRRTEYAGDSMLHAKKMVESIIRGN